MAPNFIDECARNIQFPLELSALLAALRLQKASTEALQKLPDDKWRELLDFADLSHLTLTISQLPNHGFPDWLIERLRGNAQQNAERYERVKSTYIEASAALDDAQVEHIVLKGF